MSNNETTQSEDMPQPERWALALATYYDAWGRWMISPTTIEGIIERISLMALSFFFLVMFTTSGCFVIYWLGLFVNWLNGG